jgi:hypothetical protein
VAGGERGNVNFEARFSVAVVPSVEFKPSYSGYGDQRGALNSSIDLLVGYSF